jgi:hypothetical protein
VPDDFLSLPVTGKRRAFSLGVILICIVLTIPIRLDTG